MTMKLSRVCECGLDEGITIHDDAHVPAPNGLIYAVKKRRKIHKIDTLEVFETLLGSSPRDQIRNVFEIRRINAMRNRGNCYS